LSAIFGGTSTAPSSQGERASVKKSKRDTGYLFIPGVWRKARFLVWLRRTHAWLGLWGALLGLLFGVSGFLLNHRQIMKIPAAEYAEQHQVIQVPAPARESPHAFESWLREQSAMPQAKARTQIKPAGVAPWGNGQVRQPAHWKVSLNTLNRMVTAEYWMGNNHSNIEQRKSNLWATLNRLHMGSGMGAAWVLLADSLALGLMVLATSGLLLWSRLHGPRLLALGLIGGSLATGLSLVVGSL